MRLFACVTVRETHFTMAAMVGYTWKYIYNFLAGSNFAVNSIFYSLPSNNLKGLWAKYNLTSICENDPCKRSIGIAL